MSKVTDAVPTENKLGDFYNGNTGTGIDYAYDDNGNLTKDNNKGISSITYNHLNLPSVITVTTKGTITYTYDAAGNKQKKVTVENASAANNNITTTTTTTYIGGIVYESKTDNNPKTIDYTDQLQFISHEEGRFRSLSPPSGGWGADYFIKDHLGNVRMVLTEEQKSDPYPAVTFEDANLTLEQTYYDNVDVQRTARPGAFFTSSTNGSEVQLLRKSTTALGASKLLKVMAGDKIETRVDYYIPSGTTDNNNANGLNSIINSLLNLLNSASAPNPLKGSGNTITGDLNSSTPFTSFMAPQGTGLPSSLPKAYLNIVFFDEQFKFVQTNSQAIPANIMGTAQHIVKIGTEAATALKNGYVYIYVSNESNNMVYFDNLQVTHKPGPILEETHYYPFGLTMQGISSKALNFGSPENKYKFNKGSELQSNEFSDGSGLELYATNFRSLDPQLGRWWQIDSKPNYAQSLYSAMGNNPILINDPLGDTTNPVVRGTQSAATTTSATLVKSEQVRKDYVKKVSNLDPTDSKGRNEAKIEARKKTPAVMKAVAEKMRPMSEEASRATGTASKTNAGVNTVVEKLGTVGKVAGVAAVGISVYNVATSDNKPQAIAIEGGALIGAAVGGN